MNDDIYKLRRKVIDVIYEAKNKGFKLPRIEVRIVENGEANVMGYAYLSENIVHIRKEYTSVEGDTFTHLVLHEIVHAVTGFGHDDDCFLMNPYIPNLCNIEKSWQAFNKYLTK